MSESIQDAVPTQATATTKPTKAKRASKPTAEAGPAKERSPITKPQARILSALAKATKPMPPAKLADVAAVAPTWLAGFTFKACKANRTPSLVEQKLAKVIEVDVDGGRPERLVEITAAGRKALERLNKAK